MPIHRYARVLFLAPPIGGAVLAVLGLLAGALLLGWGRPENRTLGSAGQYAPLYVPPGGVTPTAASYASSARMGSPTPENEDSGGVARLHSAIVTGPVLWRGRAVLMDGRTMFQRPIASDRLKFLTDYAGLSTNEVVRERGVRNLVDFVAPYTPFHLGIDMPLPQAIESMFSLSSAPVEVRDGRYVMLTGTRGPNTRGRAFLWIDTREGLALGGIFFYPTNGEPTPTLTIFSSQVNKPSLKMSQLPVAFVQDLSGWAAAGGVPAITTRYFINASREKTVLAHDENPCGRVDGTTAPAPDVCKQMKAEAVDIDREASKFLGQTNYASNATARMISANGYIDGHAVP